MNRVSKPEFLSEVTRKGNLIESHIQNIKDKVSIIGDVRAKGLMIGTEFVDPNGKPDMLGSLPNSGDVALKVQQECFKRGLVVEKGGRNGSVMRCLCALNISDEDIEKAMKIFEDVIVSIDSEIKK